MNTGRGRQPFGRVWAAARLGHLHLLLALPIFLIAGYAVGQMVGLATAGVISTFLLGAFSLRVSPAPQPTRGGLQSREQLVQHAERLTQLDAKPIGVFTLEIDRFKSLNEHFDHHTLATLASTCGQRLASTVRSEDLVAQIDRSTFVVVSASEPELDLEAGIQIATRLQAVASKPIDLGDMQLQITISVGFCLSNRLRKTSTEELFLASTTAMVEAQRNGPAAIRSYSDAMRDRIVARRNLAQNIPAAFENGEISAHFQPQVCTKDRRITGFEALARWHHPRLGPVYPADFLHAMRDAGALEQLGRLMVRQALEALVTWDARGFDVPRVAVNLSHVELSDPTLVPDIQAELTRQGLTADRLGIEVLETVIASEATGTLIDNLKALADLGCTIDLDDFGTGHASITSIRRFSIARIKIDRSFVTQIDADEEQQDMVVAILTMADRLGVDALAEGVETYSEELMLGRLGCGHIQGYGVARPMPLSETHDWIAAHQGRLPVPSSIAHHAMHQLDVPTPVKRIGKTA